MSTELEMIDRNSETEAMFIHLFFLGVCCFTILYFFVTFCQGKMRN